MEQFAGITLDEIGARYKNDHIRLIRDLMAAGLLCFIPPVCHGEMVIQPSRPWCWRCLNRDCQITTPVVTPGCFLFGRRKFYSVFKAAYLWVKEYSPNDIKREAGRLLMVVRQTWELQQGWSRLTKRPSARENTTVANDKEKAVFNGCKPCWRWSRTRRVSFLEKITCCDR